MAKLTKQEILEKAIHKAIENGWDTKGVVYIPNELLLIELSWEGRKTKHLPTLMLPSSLIFNHDFAKALWGEDMGYIIATEHDETVGTAWQYHLQQMVIADDPIAYLGEHLA